MQQPIKGLGQQRRSSAQIDAGAAAVKPGQKVVSFATHAPIVLGPGQRSAASRALDGSLLSGLLQSLEILCISEPGTVIESDDTFLVDFHDAQHEVVAALGSSVHRDRRVRFVHGAAGPPAMSSRKIVQTSKEQVTPTTLGSTECFQIERERLAAAGYLTGLPMHAGYNTTTQSSAQSEHTQHTGAAVRCDNVRVVE